MASARAEYCYIPIVLSLLYSSIRLNIILVLYIYIYTLCVCVHYAPIRTHTHEVKHRLQSVSIRHY